MATTLAGRFVNVDGDVYVIESHVSGRTYSARFHAGYFSDTPTDEPVEQITLQNYVGHDGYWPFDGNTLLGTLG